MFLFLRIPARNSRPPTKKRDMPPAPNTDRSPLRRRLLRRGAGLLTVSCLSLLLAACGNRPAQPRKPARGAANASTSLLSPTVKAQLAQSLAAVKAAVAKLHNARGARFWSSPGTYRWVIPAGATALEITADGGSGGGGNTGWARTTGDGLFYTCTNEHRCFGAGGGGGGASAVTAAGTALAIAPGGGGGGAGVDYSGGEGGGGPGGSGAETGTVLIPVVPSPGAWASCRPHCLYVGETLVITVGAGGGGAVGGTPGRGGWRRESLRRRRRRRRGLPLEPSRWPRRGGSLRWRRRRGNQRWAQLLVQGRRRGRIPRPGSPPGDLAPPLRRTRTLRRGHRRGGDLPHTGSTRSRNPPRRTGGNRAARGLTRSSRTD